MPPEQDMRRTIGVVLAKSPKLILKVGWRYLKVKKQAQRAEIQFRKRLIASGLDKETASRLAERYASTVSLRFLIKQVGLPKGMFGGNNGHK